MTEDCQVNQHQLLFWINEGKKLGIQDEHLNEIEHLFMIYGVIGTLEYLSYSNKSTLLDMIYEMLGNVCSHINIYENSMVIFVHKQFDSNECWCVII